MIAGHAIWFYLGKLFWPSDLIFIYPRWEINQASVWQYIFPVAVCALLVLLWMLRQRWRGLFVGLLFFIGTLFPVLGFFNVYPFIYSFVADHFQYLASLGIITPTAVGTVMFIKSLPRKYRLCGYALCVLLLLTLASLTWCQCRMYTGSMELYETTINRNPKCWMAYINRGVLYSNAGQPQRAFEDFNQAISLEPNNANVYFNELLKACKYGNCNSLELNKRICDSLEWAKRNGLCH